jgi:hypothetical protein
MCGMQESPVRPVEAPRGQGAEIRHPGDLMFVSAPISPPAAAPP